MAELLERALKTVELARAAGAQDAWASASRSRSVEFTLRDGKLEKVQENTSRSISLQLYVDGRYSSHSTTSLRPDRLEPFVKEAVALTRALAADPDRQLPDPSLFEGRAGVNLELADAAVDGIDPTTREKWLHTMDGVCRSHDKVISATSYFSDSHGTGAAASSNGFQGEWDQTSAWVGAEVTVRDEGDRRPEGSQWVGTRQLADLPDAEGVAQTALARALARLGAQKGPTKKGVLVVDPQQGGRLLGYLLSPANAQAIQQGSSFWKPLLGTRAFPEILTLVDDPLIPRGLGSRFFDGEGIASRRMPLVEKGVVQNVYVDTYYGRKAGMAPTTGSSSNVVIEPGEPKGLQEMLADVEDGIYLTSWLGGNADRTTGDFSFGLRGHLVEKGQLGAPVGEMNVTGNLVELFAGLVRVGNDPWPYRSTRVPTLVFDGVQFSGA